MKKLPRLTQVSSAIRHTNPYWTYKIDTYAFPDGKQGEYYYVDSRGSVMIVPRLDDGRFALVRQFRYLNNADSIEFPGGGVPAGLSIEESARRELQEETGFSSEKLVPIGKFNPFNGVTNEQCNVFLATDLEAGIATPEETEFLEPLVLTKEEIDKYIASGVLWDGMSIVAWHLYCRYTA